MVNLSSRYYYVTATESQVPGAGFNYKNAIKNYKNVWKQAPENSLIY